MPTMDEVNERIKQESLAKIREFPHNTRKRKFPRPTEISSSYNNICSYHQNGATKREYFLKKEYLFCAYADKKECPHNNGQRILFEGESAGTICSSEGLIKKL
jgi:hypothetical protein